MEEQVGIRQELLDFVNAVNEDDEDEGPDEFMVARVLDVTGSLGVWGIN